MDFERASGVLLHPTSLPGSFGIGTLGSEARRFVDFLAGAGQKTWQVLPLGPTGYGDSPYQCFSSFAGNPLLIDLEMLVDDGSLVPRDLESAPQLPSQAVDYGAVQAWKLPLLARAFEGFKQGASGAQFDEFQAFCEAQKRWLDDFAIFMALKGANQGREWTRWTTDLVRRQATAIEAAERRHGEEITAWKFSQYLFFKQWVSLRDYCHSRGIRIMGDIPIFVAHDSADVWSNQRLFHLDADGRPTYKAGVPPDYFSATGQLWGNPLYRWELHKQGGYLWWIDRVRSVLSMVDIVRLDHFRGFEAYWEIPGSETTAMRGRWVKGPGADLFEKLEAALGGPIPAVAENLGVITPEVEGLRGQFHLPGMAILQFAFGNDPQASSFKPHNYERNLVVYTGTHDNDTVVGWWSGEGAGRSTRTLREVSKEREHAREYLGADGRPIHWVFIQALLGSVADTVIIPVQDILGLGSEARMNVPAVPTGNWRWRLPAGALTEELRERLGKLTALYDR